MLTAAHPVALARNGPASVCGSNPPRRGLRAALGCALQTARLSRLRWPGGERVHHHLPNYLAQARVLAESFRAQHPNGGFSVLVIDAPSFTRTRRTSSSVRLISTSRRTSTSGWPRSYDVMELATAIKPWLLGTCSSLANPSSTSIGHRGSSSSRRRGPALRGARHRIDAAHRRDGAAPTARELVHRTVRHSGIYNLGFIAVSERALPSCAGGSSGSPATVSSRRPRAFRRSALGRFCAGAVRPLHRPRPVMERRLVESRPTAFDHDGSGYTVDRNASRSSTTAATTREGPTC
jgi:hypothetical protein